MGSKKIDNEDEIVVKKHSHTLRNIFIVILFLVIGTGVGIYGTKMYLESREEPEPDVQEKNSGPDDITNDKQTKELVDSLYAMLNNDPMFYTTIGVSVSTMDNTTKLTFIYDNLILNKKNTSKEIESLWYGSDKCNYDFLVDTLEDGTYLEKCTLQRLERNLFTETNKKIFNDELLDTSVEFKPNNTTKCIIDSEDNNYYMCGKILNESGITGALESKFTINKVTRDEDGTIVIYEKGYLKDNRSTVVNENSQYDNYYLHSSDSNQYYFELRNADNLTFKHIFKTADRLNYYYAGTELVK